MITHFQLAVLTCADAKVIIIFFEKHFFGKKIREAQC